MSKKLWKYWHALYTMVIKKKKKKKKITRDQIGSIYAHLSGAPSSCESNMAAYASGNEQERK